MAQVKISELPSIDTVAYSDVLIVNDTSSNTTTKASIDKFYVNGNGYLTAPAGVTMTENGTTITQIPFSYSVAFGRIIRVKFPTNHNILFTNTTSSPVNLVLASSIDFHLSGIYSIQDNQGMFLNNTTFSLYGNGTGVISVPANSSVNASVRPLSFCGLADANITV